MSAVRDARKAAGLTQQGMSDATGIPKRTIQEWEGGRQQPPAYVERLVVKELREIAEKNGSL